MGVRDRIERVVSLKREDGLVVNAFGLTASWEPLGGWAEWGIVSGGAPSWSGSWKSGAC